jgi:hypothetical protein
MQIIFNNTPIATSPMEGGTDAVEGFLPKRKINVQDDEFMRVTDSDPQSRGNRKRSLTGTITPAAFDDRGTAASALLLYLDTFPDQGPLKIIVGGKETTYANAVLEAVDGVKRLGVTIAVSLSFRTGPGKDTTAPLNDGNGNNLNDGNGTNLHA